MKNNVFGLKHRFCHNSNWPIWIEETILRFNIFPKVGLNALRLRGSKLISTQACFIIAAWMMCLSQMAAAQSNLESSLSSLQPYDVSFPSYGLDIGDGWDGMLDRRSNAVCVEFSIEDIGRSTFDHDSSFISNSYELAKSEFASFSGSANWGFIKASASANVDRSKKIERDSANVLSTYTFELGSTRIAPLRTLGVDDVPAIADAEEKRPIDDILFTSNGRAFHTSEAELRSMHRGGAIRLTAEARQLLEQLEASDEPIEVRRAKFRQMCGTGFVSAVRRGLRISVLASKSVNSVFEKEALEASARGSGWGFKFSGKFSSTQSETNTDTAVSFKIRQSGGGSLLSLGTGDQVFNPETFHTSIDLSEAYQSPSSFSATIFPYSSLVGVDPNLVGETFEMDKYSIVYYFLTDLLQGYEEQASQIYAAAFEEAQNPDLDYSALSIAAAGGSESVLDNRVAIRRTIQALVEVLERCYYSDLALDAYANSSLGQGCQPETALKSVSERYVGTTFEVPDPTGAGSSENSGALRKDVVVSDGGLGFLTATAPFDEKNSYALKFTDSSDVDGQLVEILVPKSLRVISPVDVSGSDMHLKSLVSTLFEYAIGLPLAGDYLSVETAANATGIEAHELKNKQNELTVFIRNAVFYARLLTIRDELCEISSAQEICWTDAELRALLLEKIPSSYDAEIFPEKEVAPPPPKRPSVDIGASWGCYRDRNGRICRDAP